MVQSICYHTLSACQEKRGTGLQTIPDRHLSNLKKEALVHLCATRSKHM